MIADSPTVPPLVLYVEDDPLLHDLVQDGLSDAGFTVLVASGAKEGLTLVETRGAELQGLVTDINLGPGLDGWAVAREARKRHPGLAVVYVSGLEAAEWPAQGVPNSVVISKPFATAQLVVAMASLMNTRDRELPRGDGLA